MAEKKFNGREFRFSKMLALDAVELQRELIALAGPDFDKFRTILGGVGEIDKQTGLYKDPSPEQKEAASAAIIQAFANIAARCKRGQLSALLTEIFRTCEIRRPSGYDQVDANDDFTENLSEMWQVAAWILQEQFGAFFPGRRGGGNPGQQIRD